MICKILHGYLKGFCSTIQYLYFLQNAVLPRLSWDFHQSLNMRCPNMWCTVVHIVIMVHMHFLYFVFIYLAFPLQGFRCVPAYQCWNKSLAPLMEEVRTQMGDGPVYISFDIDGIDPSYCPGTGGVIPKFPNCACFLKKSALHIEFDNWI